MGKLYPTIKRVIFKNRNDAIFKIFTIIRLVL